jgi:hypothetical protein
MYRITHNKNNLSLTFPEQNIRIPGCAKQLKRGHTALLRDSFALLNFDVVCYQDMSEQRFHFVSRQKPPRAV